MWVPRMVLFLFLCKLRWPSCDTYLAEERLKQCNMNFGYNGCNDNVKVYSPLHSLWVVIRNKQWTHKFEIKSFMLHDWWWPFFLYKLYVEVSFVLELILQFCTYCYNNFEQTIPSMFKLSVCVQLWKKFHVPMYKIITFNIAMSHFVLSHNITRCTNYLSSHIHVNITKFYNIKCTSVATCVILWRLRYIYHCIFTFAVKEFT